jgi:hypothetical protein
MLKFTTVEKNANAVKVSNTENGRKLFISKTGLDPQERLNEMSRHITDTDFTTASKNYIAANNLYKLGIIQIDAVKV